MSANPSVQDIPDRPEYQSEAVAAMDNALCKLRSAAADADDDYHRQLAVNLLGSLRVKADEASPSDPPADDTTDPLEAGAILPEEQTLLEGTAENAVLSLRANADELEARDEIDDHLQDVIEGLRLVADELDAAVEQSYTSRESGGVKRTASDLSQLEEMLGWNSVAIFSSGKHFDGNTLHLNRDTTLVVMADPYPEYTEIVFLDGEFHHQDGLTANSYEAVLRDKFEDHGEARVVPLSAVDCVGRDDHGSPQYIGEGNDA
jgi:hypothetical protein